MKSAFRYLHTVRYISLTQLFYRLYYTLKRPFIERYNQCVFAYYEKAFCRKKLQVQKITHFAPNMKHYYPHEISDLLENKITFLNHTIHFSGEIDWHHVDLNTDTALWKFTLNYHEFLVEVAKCFLTSRENRYLDYIVRTIDTWIIQNPMGTKGYGKGNWNSYVLSLRIVAWIKLYSIIGAYFTKEFSEKFLKCLWIQSAFLHNNLELDILGNHLIKNWKALVWAGKFFRCDEYDLKADKIYKKHIRRQFVNFMHEELSPMYMGIVLEDFLEVLLLNKEDQELREMCTKQYRILDSLTFAGQYSLFNDSVNNSSIQLSELRNLMKINGFSVDCSDNTGFKDLNGFIIDKRGNEHFIMDCAPVVLGKQPGHAHCDALSFEYHRDGYKLFTNSGTFEYKTGKRRVYSKSTEAHNTLKYGAYDQSETWDSFRVARRAQVSYETLVSGDEVTIKAVLKGFHFSKKVCHFRTVVKSTDSIVIEDLVESPDARPELSAVYLHLDPRFEYKSVNAHQYQIVERPSRLIIGEAVCSREAQIRQTDYYPEFGMCEQKFTLIVDNVACGKKVTLWINFHKQ